MAGGPSPYASPPQLQHLKRWGSSIVNAAAVYGAIVLFDLAYRAVPDVAELFAEVALFSSSVRISVRLFPVFPGEGFVFDNRSCDIVFIRGIPKKLSAMLMRWNCMVCNS